MLPDEIKEVNARKKKLDGLLTIFIIILVVWIIILYMSYFRPMLQGTLAGEIFGSIKTEIASFSTLGALYVALFGGLFFIWIPLEAYYFTSINHGHPIMLYALFVMGVVISYSMNYVIGERFSKIFRRFISAKQFYKVKIMLNRYGKLAIFVANAVPMAPSPQIMFILGVFRYNKLRLFVLMLTGNLLKYGYLLLIWKLL